MAFFDLLTDEEARTAINLGDAAAVAAELAMWVTAISERVDQVCGPVVHRTVTEELHDGGRDTITLRRSPAAEVTTVLERAGNTTVELTAETFTERSGERWATLQLGRTTTLVRRTDGRDAIWAPGRDTVAVTYVAGRAPDTSTVPSRFKLAAGAVLRRLWQREQGAWATGGDPFTEMGGRGAFFRAVDPMLAEWLPDDMRTQAVA